MFHWLCISFSWVIFVMSAITRHFRVGFNRKFLPKQRQSVVGELRVWIFVNDRAVIYIHFVFMAVIQTSVGNCMPYSWLTRGCNSSCLWGGSSINSSRGWVLESYGDAKQTIVFQCRLFLCHSVDCLCSSGGLSVFCINFIEYPFNLDFPLELSFSSISRSIVNVSVSLKPNVVLYLFVTVNPFWFVDKISLSP